MEDFKIDSLQIQQQRRLPISMKPETKMEEAMEKLEARCDQRASPIVLRRSQRLMDRHQAVEESHPIPAGIILGYRRSRSHNANQPTKAIKSQTNGTTIKRRRSQSQKLRNSTKETKPRDIEVPANLRIKNRKLNSPPPLRRSSRPQADLPIRFRDSYILGFLRGSPNLLPTSFYKTKAGPTVKSKSTTIGEPTEKQNESTNLTQRAAIGMTGSPTSHLNTSSTSGNLNETGISTPEPASLKPQMKDVGTDTCNILTDHQISALGLMDDALTQIKNLTEGNPAPKYWSISVVVNEVPEPSADCKVEPLGEPVTF